MQIKFGKQELTELIQTVVDATIAALESKKLLGKANANGSGKPEKSAYAKTESLLYNYRNFQKIVEERRQEIEEIRKYGVPKKSKSITQYGGECGGTPTGLVLEEESVEAAVRTVEASVEGTVQALALIDKCMESLKKDPYYCILEMRYFEGRTQEDIAIELKCTQKTISIQKSRLVKELAMRLFPNDVINEYMS